MTQEIDEAFIAAIMERLYRQRPSYVERLGGGVNMHVYAASFGDTQEDRVIKLAGEGRWKPWAILDEEAAMRALREQGILEVPEIEYTQEDLGWSTIPFFTTRRIQPGVMIENQLGPDDPEAERIWRQAGALRARFGQVDWQCTTRTLTPRQAAEQILRFAAGVEKDFAQLPAYQGVFAALIAAVRKLALAQGEFFGQGDAAEVLTAGDDGLALVDFSGFVGAHRRLRELGQINGRLRWRYQGDPRVADWHEQGFFGDETITAEMRQELTIWGIYSLVSGVGWMTQVGWLTERDSQLAYARQWLQTEHPV